MTAAPPMIYVIDDDPSVGKALERLMRSAGHQVRTFSSAIDFVRCKDLEAPACLVLDVSMPDLNGLELQEYLADREISPPIVFITGHGTVPMSVKAMKAGALDFLEKPFHDADLLNAIAHAIATDRLTRNKHQQLKKLQQRMETLTARERQVFHLVVTGLPNKQIAVQLGTAEKTIKVHQARVMTKMGAQSLADLVRFADQLSTHSPPRDAP